MVYSEITSDIHIMVEDSIESYQINSFNTFRCIFYIDDSEMDRWLARYVLEASGMCTEIKTASNGEEGLKAILEYCSINSRFPDVIIVDLQMPRMDGFALISTIKAHSYYLKSNTKIILTSAGLGDIDLRKIEELQIENILLKPLDQNDLKRVLGIKH